MTWDIMVWRTREGAWAARCNTWRSNHYHYLIGLMTAMGFHMLNEYGRSL